MPSAERPVVVDSTPVIALAGLGQLGVLHRLYGEVLVPSRWRRPWGGGFRRLQSHYSMGQWALVAICGFTAVLICLPMQLEVELERENDGRWIADVIGLPGVLAYGETPEEALRGARALALRVLADKIEHGEVDSPVDRVEFLLPHPLPAA